MTRQPATASNARGGRGRPATTWEPRLVRPADAELAPADPEAEASLLGALLIDDSRFPDVARILAPAHFHGPARAAVFAAMIEVRHRGQALDNVTVRVVLESSDEPAPEGGWSAALTRLLERVPTAVHAVHYATIIRRKAEQRRMIAAAGEIARLGHDGAADALDQARAILASMDSDIERAESGEVYDALADLMAPRPDGWSTGIGVLDQWLGDVGLVPGRVLTLTGKSGVGKTWLAATSAMSALDAGARVAFFTLEMTRAEVLVRLAAPRLGGRVFRLLRAPAHWTDADHDTHSAMVALFDRRPLYVFEAQRSVFDIAVKARAVRADVVVVDWYQQLDVEWSGGDQTADQVDRSHALALLDLAMRAPSCVVVVSQLNKDGSMKYGAWLNAYSAAHLTLANDTDSGDGIVVLRPEKNRWGPDSAAGSEARFSMDKSRGVLTPIHEAPGRNGSKPARASAEPRDWVGDTW